jgi:uncharacterized Fe-S center protein
MNAKEARENTFQFRHVPYDDKLQPKVTKSPCVITYKNLRKYLLDMIDQATKDGEFKIEHYIDTSIEKIHSETLTNISFNLMEMGYDVCVKRSFLQEIIDFISSLKFHKVFLITVKW